MRLHGLLATSVLAFAIPASAGTSTFPAGSLIIPTSSAYQNDCGAVSAYGLVYDVLRANAWLASNGYTQITIRYAYLDTKLFIISTCIRYPDTPKQIVELVSLSGGGTCYKSQFGGCGGNGNSN